MQTKGVKCCPNIRMASFIASHEHHVLARAGSMTRMFSVSTRVLIRVNGSLLYSIMIYICNTDNTEITGIDAAILASWDSNQFHCYDIGIMLLHILVRWTSSATGLHSFW